MPGVRKPCSRARMPKGISISSSSFSSSAGCFSAFLVVLRGSLGRRWGVMIGLPPIRSISLRCFSMITAFFRCFSRCRCVVTRLKMPNTITAPYCLHQLSVRVRLDQFRGYTIASARTCDRESSVSLSYLVPGQAGLTRHIFSQRGILSQND